MSSLYVNDLVVRYGKTTILNKISAVFEQGVTAVLGVNGAGKTTLFKSLATLLPVSDGHIDLGGYTRPSDIRANLGYVPQSFGTYPYLTVKETLEHFAVLRGISKCDVPAAVERALNDTDLLSLAQKKAGTLSGGMMRRLGIAQAILARPMLLLIDEPTAGLDPEECIRFRMLLRRLSQETIVLFSTHIVDDLPACDHVCVLHNGKCRSMTTTAGLAQFANGHVREGVFSQQEAAELAGKKIVVRSYSQGDNCMYMRWLEEECIEHSPQPSAEDGYIWVTHF